MFLRERLSAAALAFVLAWPAAVSAAPSDARASTTVRVLNAITGQELHSANVRSLRSPDGRPVEVQTSPEGSQRWLAGRGTHLVEISVPGFQAMSAEIAFGDAALPVMFRLQPEDRLDELRPERILARTRPDATLVLGFVVDDATGRPLANARVRSWPAGVESSTDDRGFFELFVPIPVGAAPPSTDLIVERAGYQSEARQHVELWPGGDWTYQVRLSRGVGERFIDERLSRRWSGAHAGGGIDPAPGVAILPGDDATIVPAASGPTNLTVRVPQTIRVLYTNVVIYETMENYCRHVLPAEWISSWGGYTGGSNSLQAGAVALRTYAIGYVNQPAAATYDICATTSCQVYNPGLTTSRADLAVAQTAGYVMVSSNLNITRGLTEYSAENNQLGMACGDGFTAPAGICLADPVCAGEAEFGHGRGMCQWGTVKWATGLKFPGNNFSNTTQTNGQPRRDWAWIARHYFPNLILVKGTPLAVGDEVRATSATLNVRRCPGDSITNGVNCPAVGSVPAGTTGLIAAGPEQVSADGSGYTWWYVHWTTGLSGWVVENYLARVIPTPPAPLQVAAEGLSTSQVRVGWLDNSELESGFSIEQAVATGGPWIEATTVPANVAGVVISNLAAQTTWYFRVRAFNLAGYSSYSTVASSATFPDGIALQPIPDQAVDEGSPLAFAAEVSGDGRVQALIDFESFEDPTINGAVLFRSPTFSGSTSAFLEPAPNVSGVTGGLPAGTAGTRALKLSWSFTSASNGWLRLTTFGAATLPNPVIDLNQSLRLRFYTDRPLGLAVGLRETVTAASTPLGADGGATGAIEWAGVTGRINGQPQPARTLPPGVWTTVTFHFANEPILTFTGGDGALVTASGLAVLEHLALVPADGPGVYSVFLDQVEVVDPRPLLFALGPGSPAGASIDPSSGWFAWTPAEEQGPGTNSITINVTDNSVPARTDSETFSVVVNEVNRPPGLTGTSEQVIHSGLSLILTNVALDPDIPVQGLVFSLEPPVAPGAAIDPVTGVIHWLTPEVAAESTNTFLVKVTDRGTPPLDALRPVSVRVVPRPIVRVHFASEDVEIGWDSIPGRRYQIQFASSVTAPVWMDLGGPITALGGSASTIDRTVDHQRFYRITLLD